MDMAIAMAIAMAMESMGPMPSLRPTILPLIDNLSLPIFVSDWQASQKKLDGTPRYYKNRD